MSSSFSAKSKNVNYGGIREFMESNTLVSKFAFLILVIIGFIILLKLGVSFLSYFTQPNKSPHLIDGMVDATQMLVYPQDPNGNSAVTIYRSSNETKGIEFTWSVWIYINNLQTNAGIYKHIFSKGNSDLTNKGLVYPNNAPGLYIAPNTNDLVIMMNTFTVINEEIVVNDIPLNKWVNVIIRCENTTVDVYINGTIVRSVDFTSVPKQNYGNVYVAMNGGFSGYISNLWYYNYALPPTSIQTITANGPNTKMVGTSAINDSTTNYLSLSWLLNHPGDMYNS